MQVAGLIVGLGNPGKEYDNTRHNMGFMAVDALMDDARRFQPDACTPLSSGKKKYLLWKCFPGGLRTPWLIAKPQTYMNLSGDAVGHICGFYNLNPEQVLVVHDELDLPLGRMKFKTGGGLAGHNGLKSIAQHLGTRDFHRLRLGIGKPDHPNTASYVLSRFSPQEWTTVQRVMVGAVRGMLCFAEQGATQAIHMVNAFDAGV
ncbi:aminoacyl-tRNA hydrolase [Desulfovibrio psychrotolerans]|uniref:Peptidyl-tRNA hydrolase n=1 Tax=Desulfovibrio psychrotolerans TaxID=415242 RepID=A0A7J0BXF4_9BACT|nr:aminoacyl-tRNA hydrolase [Desulfovibrio psychrotolerans]GFM38373.1 peptidyl-tRNA hydrolase [Desulfovibrio psychrotolerans]